jgi:hypothetical protein
VAAAARLNSRAASGDLPPSLQGASCARNDQRLILDRPLCFTDDTPTSSDTGRQRLVRARPKNADVPRSPFPHSGSPGAVGRHNNTPNRAVFGAGTASTRSSACPRDARHATLYGILGASSDVVLCPDVVPVIDRRFDCCDLSQRGVIHHGTAKASAVMGALCAGQSLRRHARRAQSTARSRAERRLCEPRIRSGAYSADVSDLN